MQTPCYRCPHISGVDHFQGPWWHKKGGLGIVSMETSSWITKKTNKRKTEKKKKDKKKNKNPKQKTVEGSIHWHVFIFFPFKCSFSSKQFLNRLRVVWIFRSLFSSASLTYSHTENKCLCLISEDKKTKKALHIYIKKFGATFFSQSSQSSYTSVSRLSFLVIWHDQ